MFNKSELLIKSKLRFSCFWKNMKYAVTSLIESVIIKFLLQTFKQTKNDISINNED